MRRITTLILGAAMVVGVTPVRGAGQARPDTPRAPREANATEKALEAVANKAIVVDVYGVTMEIERPRFHLEESGLFSAGKAKALDKLVLWRGAHQLLISPSRIAVLETIAGKKPQGDLIEVRVTLRSGEAVEGKVALDLELRGTTRYGGYRIRVERCRRIEFVR